MSEILAVTLEASIIVCALLAGVFLTFSDFVMKSLRAAKPAAGIEVMQIINRKVWATVFMVLLLGFACVSALLVGYAYLNLAGMAGLWIIAGGMIYLIGVIVVSLVFNVPMNNRLDVMDCNSAHAASYWQSDYVPRWTYWNWIRALSGAAAAICYLTALLLL